MLILAGAVLVAYWLGNSSITPKPTPPAPVSSSNLRYAVSASECEENLRRFRLKLRTVASGSTQTAEGLEAVYEKLVWDTLPPGYGVRREGDMIANGGCR
jgi:hypothetical protein